MAEFDVCLIDEVQSRPNLYNRTLQCYRDKKQRDQAWQEIAAKLSTTAQRISVSDCQRRWKGLRDKFGRIRKRELAENGEFVSHEYWDLAEKMSFLDEFRMTRTFCSPSTTGEDNSLIDSSRPTMQPSFIFSNPPKLEPPMIMSIAENLQPKNVAKKLKLTRDSSEADELFFASLLCELTKLTPRKKGKLKIDIMYLVHNALYDVTDDDD
uniref:MADF domain-containing protein n=1 Tax=Ciona savignyi TaxID=51511 RepID=H2YZZ5_CIOSA